MTRRGFFKTLAAATAGFTILPPATTYQRIWKAMRPSLGCTFYELPFNPREFMGKWEFISWVDPIKPGPFLRGVGDFVDSRFFQE